MNTNTNEPNELTPLITQPTATTRRSFIKRTASAAMVATFALGAFENEALAQTAGGSILWALEMTGTPESEADPDQTANPNNDPIIATRIANELPIRLRVLERIAVPPPVPAAGSPNPYYIITGGVKKNVKVETRIVITCAPDHFKRTKAQDGNWHYIYAGEGISAQGTVYLKDLSTGAIINTYNGDDLKADVSYSLTINEETGRITATSVPDVTAGSADDIATKDMREKGRAELRLKVQILFGTVNGGEIAADNPAKVLIIINPVFTIHQLPEDVPITNPIYWEILKGPTTWQETFSYSGFPYPKP